MWKHCNKIDTYGVDILPLSICIVKMENVVAILHFELCAQMMIRHAVFFLLDRLRSQFFVDGHATILDQLTIFFLQL